MTQPGRERPEWLAEAQAAGISADARASATFVAPNARNPRRLDIASVAGLVGVVRTRPEAEAPSIFMNSVHNDRSVRTPAPDSEDDFAGPLTAFNTGNLPPMVESSGIGRRGFIFDGGQLGEAGRFSCFFLRRLRSTTSRFRDERNSYGRIRVGVSTPARRLQVDLFFHRLLIEIDELVVTFDTSGVPWDLPVAGSPHQIAIPDAARPFDPETQLDPQPDPDALDRYPDAIREVFRTSKWSPADFRGVRIVLDHPETRSSLTVTYNLPRALSPLP